MGDRLGVAVDIGATQIRVCLGDENGVLHWRSSRRLTFPQRVEEFVDQVIRAVREGLDRCPSPELLAGIGLASTGPLDLEKGGMARPSNIPYDFVPLVGPVESAFGYRVVLMNDANAAALGERTFGAGKGHENLVYVTISSGIGGGAIVDGHLLMGKGGNAAEIGHLVVDPAGRLRCGCGRSGHWEAYCSGKNIPNFARLLARVTTGGSEQSVASLLGSGEWRGDSAAIFSAAHAGNEFGMRVIAEVGRLNAMGVANAVNMFDPSLITIGGGVALAHPDLVLTPIREFVPTYSVNRVPDIVITPLGDDAGVLGALSLVFNRQE